MVSWSQLGRDAHSLLSQIGAVGHHFDSLTVAMVAEILSSMETGKCYKHYKSSFFFFFHQHTIGLSSTDCFVYEASEGKRLLMAYPT